MILLGGAFLERKRGRERRPRGDEVVFAVRLCLRRDWELSRRFPTSANCSLRHARSRTMIEAVSPGEEESTEDCSLSVSSSLQVASMNGNRGQSGLCARIVFFRADLSCK